MQLLHLPQEVLGLLLIWPPLELSNHVAHCLPIITESDLKHRAELNGLGGSDCSFPSSPRRNTKNGCEQEVEEEKEEGGSST